MKSIGKIVFIALTLSICSNIHISGQAVKTKVIKATTPADDSKSNSDSIPDVIPVYGEFDRILVLRIPVDW